jgi:bifunctional DNase/RNase
MTLIWDVGNSIAKGTPTGRWKHHDPMTYQFPVNLLTASGARLRELLITSLAEGILYAEVIIDADTGQPDIDARSSDGLNLAPVADAAILVDADLIDNREATRHTAWQDYPTGAQDTAHEVPERQQDLQARLTDYAPTNGTCRPTPLSRSQQRRNPSARPDAPYAPYHPGVSH